MADVKIGRAVLEISIDDKQYKIGLGQVEKDSDKTAGHIRGISQALNLGVFREFGQVAVSAVRTVAEGFAALVQRGSEVQGISSSFDALTASVGETRESMLETTRTATKGLIADFDLMAAANKAMLLGLPVTSKSMGTMAQAATVLGRAMGQDAKKSFDDLITALGRGSPLILDNLGITVKVSEANEAYAKALGKSAAQLTEGEKKMAFYNAAMEAARKKVEEIGGIHLTVADHVQVAMVAVQNFTDQLGVAVNQSPVFQAGMAVIGDAIQENLGKNQQTTIQTVMGFVERFAISVLKAAGVVVEGARFMSNAWNGLQFIFNSWVSGTLQGIGTVVSGLATFVEAASKIPGTGEAFKAAAGPARALADDILHLASGFRIQAEQAVDSAARNNAALDTVKGGLDKVAGAMEANLGKSGQMAQGVRTNLGRVGDAATTTATRTEEQTRKIAEAYRKLEQEIELSTKMGMEKRLLELKFAEENEIAQARALTATTVAEKDRQVLLIQEKYRLMTQAALMGSDEIRDRHQQLEQEIALAQSTGTARRLLEIEFARQKELMSLELLKQSYVLQYAELAALVNAKYNEMRDTAQGTFRSIEAAAGAAGFKTRAELQQAADKARQTYQAMLDSGKFTYGELQKAHQAAKDAEAALDEKVSLTKKEQLDLILASTSTILRSLFGKNKAAAIAATIIDTYRAIAAALGAYPWPFNLAPAAAAAAAGWAQVNAIRSQNAAGFAAGTPNLDFANFGRVSLTPLHRNEAVIPQGSGHLLAGEIAAALPGTGDDDLGATMREMLDEFRALPNSMKRAFRDGLLLST